MRSLFGYAAALSAIALHATSAIKLDINSPDSIKAASKQIASRMLEKFYYGGNPKAYYSGVPGLLPQAPVKYYWWQAGSMMLTLIDLWYFTGDDTFNSLITEGMLFQTGPQNTYMPPNQTSSLGNDDQVFWAFAAMAAAEYNFPNPPTDKPQWLALGQAVFNTQIARWDEKLCGGGLRWQIYSFNAGWDYKNSASNSGLFNLAARLALYTKNSTYQQWAEKIFDWQERIGLYGKLGETFDGSDDLLNCTEISHVEWSYTAGMNVHGAAAMYKLTNASIWADRVNAVWNNTATKLFTQDKIMTESACEANQPKPNCNVDMLSFKSTYIRFLAASTKYYPPLYDKIKPYLAASAVAAAAQCIGGAEGDLCGTIWFNGPVWDGTFGVGQQMSAFTAIAANLIKDGRNPVSNDTGGTSIGDPTAGTGPTGQLITYEPITTADRAGAGILTAMVLVGTIGLVWFSCN